LPAPASAVVNVLTRPHEVAAVHHQVHVTLLEDKGMIEAQYVNRREVAAESADRLIRADRAAVMARRVNERILRVEHENRDD
jgi:hypothetical protein